MLIIPGKAQLEIYPHLWPRPSVEAASAVLSALWKAHPCIMAVTLGYNDPPITVDVAIPADGSLDLHALQRQLQEAVQQIIVPFRRCCDRCGKMNLGGCDRAPTSARLCGALHPDLDKPCARLAGHESEPHPPHQAHRTTEGFKWLTRRRGPRAIDIEIEESYCEAAALRLGR